jgi:hypothetical protein
MSVIYALVAISCIQLFTRLSLSLNPAVFVFTAGQCRCYTAAVWLLER